ncbi:diaminopimelate decarboxylase [Thermus aquaticus]|uniref:Diaminopimelate decarboxylase n=1 Tax=Thermus aquaticus (strain ATCC BAA-2747 / Y51MC23) TaxID=498848 RepID=A0ABN4IGH8_THEA5|nr:Diaminopimelate decarboxylase [Thermus aquaticus Y51MC23]
MLNPDFLSALREAARAYPTPFYAYDWTAIKKRAEAFREAFPLARPFFALKANPRLGLLRRPMGYGAEAVSLGEVLRAYRAGFSPEEVVWNGPVKTPEALEALRGREPLVVLDLEADLRRVAALLPGARVLIPG